MVSSSTDRDATAGPDIGPSGAAPSSATAATAPLDPTLFDAGPTTRDDAQAPRDDAQAPCDDAQAPCDDAAASAAAGPAAAGNVVMVDLGDAARAVARREAVAEAGDDESVGELIDAYSDGDAVVTARFAAAVDGYRGWQWSVTMVLLDAERPTVSEVVLLPGPAALIAPAWVPWKQRVRSGDLGVGDLLPTPPDDARIVPAYLQSDDPAVEELAREIGIGRVRVMSREGRAQAAQRWHAGDFGPYDEMAKHAPGTCATCAFFVPVAGVLGANFGVCGNEYSPADGHVVDVAYGCGAHSEATVRRKAASATTDTVVDELQLEVHWHADTAGTETADTEVAGTETADTDPAGTVVADTDPADTEAGH